MSNKAFKNVLVALMNMTPQELVEEVNKYQEGLDAEYGDIPPDRNCHECPHSDAGRSQGMVTPCFDVCSGAVPFVGQPSHLKETK